MKNKKICFLILLVILAILAAIYYVFVNSASIKGELNDIFNLSIEVENTNSDDSVQAELDENITVTANIPIFMYHWVRESTGDYEYPEMMVKPSELKLQMEYLKENNYDVIFVSELDNIQHYEKIVILTFDDGWEDVYYDVFPLAKEYNIKINMYVIIDLIGTNGYCTLEQLEEMRDSGLVEISSHTMSHAYLDEVTLEEATEELVNSKTYLNETLGVSSTVICYPSGKYSSVSLEVARQNYDYGLLMDGGVFEYNSDTSDMFLIPRIYATRSMSLTTFSNYCETAYVQIN